MTRVIILQLLIAALTIVMMTSTGLAHYSPAQGRWMERDPIGYEDGMNSYSYVGARPIHRFDPDGLKERPIDGGYGATRCDYDDPKFKGKPTTRDLNELCVGECIKKHEEKRRNQLSSCCARLNKCLKKYTRSSCTRAYNTWLEANRRAFDCEAQQSTAACITGKINQKKCRSDKPKCSSACCKELLDQEDRVRRQVLANCLNPSPSTQPCPFDKDGN